MKITTEVVVSSSHFLPDYPGPCRMLHGHNWKIKVTIEGAIDPVTGMVQDFAWVKHVIKNRLDHTLLNNIADILRPWEYTQLLEGQQPWTEKEKENYTAVVHGVLMCLGINPDQEGVVDYPTAEILSVYVGELILEGLEERGDAVDGIVVEVWESDVSYAQAVLGKDF